MNKNDSYQRKLNLFAPVIINLGNGCYRDFPWRKELNNPYKTICTEILLQKTVAENVRSVYNVFFERYPTNEALAKADLNEIIDIIRPTGLFNKKSQCLIDTARWIEKNGLTKQNILKLKTEVKGISSYVINAVLCFTFGKNVALIDVNVKKIFHLFFDSTDDLENILLKSTSKLSSEQLKKFYFGIIDIAYAIRSKKYMPLDEIIAIATIDEKSYKNLKNKGYYWRFRKSAFKKDVKILAFYRKSPLKSITDIGWIKDVENSDFTIYRIDALYELNPPINLQKNEYPAVSYKYSTIKKILDAGSYSNT